MTIPAQRLALLYPFCRLQMPAVALPADRFAGHVERAYRLYQAKSEPAVDPDTFLDQLYALDLFLCSACLEGDGRAWEILFAARTGRSDCLLVDALRARAARMYPRDEEKQDAAVTEFWGHLLAGDRSGAPPVLARYDGQRPLVPWLIRVFQNLHLSDLRRKGGTVSLPDEDVALPLPETGDARWHEAFRAAARDWLGTLAEPELLLLGLRWRYRLSQREVAQLLGIHEGNVTRRIDKLRDRCLDRIGRRLRQQGWTGDDLAGFVLSEMGSLLTDEPRLSADQLARMLRAQGKKVPDAPPQES
ncbi:MAG TPA: sigma-70 family RNA polymerase sigma factor [Gemmataceae bacterium]